jgi:hypothetical protein
MTKMQGKEAFEIHIAAVHDVEGAWFRQQDIEDVDVVQFAVGDMDEGRDVATQVQEGMELDGGLGRTKQRPWKDRQAQVDGGGIECIDGVVEFEPQILVGIERAGHADQGLGEIGVDAPVTPFVGPGQRVACHVRRTKAHVVQLALMGLEARLDIAKALSMSELGKRHDEILVETTEPLHIAFALIPDDAPAKGV